ncbi:protein kinase domain-containing protein [Kistimonas asteriae]|uniref:protein kinase domain-containing protein n=1 Tax=Kistimonas asteriae TaxID=517724 RepID=UPI001BA63332|nr:protein kinase [Kistimonas asteriae]
MNKTTATKVNTTAHTSQSGNSSEVGFRDEGYFCCRFVCICECIGNLIKRIGDWFKEYADEQAKLRSYKVLRKKYNVAHVLEGNKTNNMLGDGEYSKVFRYNAAVINKDTAETQPIAYKVKLTSEPHSCSKEFPAEIVEQCERSHNKENKALSDLSHPNLMKRLQLSKNESQVKQMTLFSLVSESAEEESDSNTKGDDFEMIESFDEQDPGIPLPLMDCTLGDAVSRRAINEKDKHVCMIQISSALDYMHHKGWAHLDVKPENVFKKGNTFVLGDFGNAHHYKEMYKGKKKYMPVFNKKTAEIFYGTLGYVSPQMYTRFLYSIDDLPCDKFNFFLKEGGLPAIDTDARAADAYSLGATFFEMLTGELLNPDERDLKASQCTSDQIKEFYKSAVSKKLQSQKHRLGQYYGVIEGLVQFDTHQRLTVSQAYGKLKLLPEPQLRF